MLFAYFKKTFIWSASQSAGLLQRTKRCGVEFGAIWTHNMFNWIHLEWIVKIPFMGSHGEADVNNVEISAALQLTGTKQQKQKVKQVWMSGETLEAGFLFFSENLKFLSPVCWLSLALRARIYYHFLAAAPGCLAHWSLWSCLESSNAIAKILIKQYQTCLKSSGWPWRVHRPFKSFKTGSVNPQTTR